MKKLVIFDMDGVLIDSEYQYLKEILLYMHWYDRRIQIEDLFPTVGMSWENHYEYLSRLLGYKKTGDEIREEYEAYIRGVKRNYAQWMFDDVIPVIKKLKKRGCSVALASNSDKNVIDEVLEQCEIEYLFDLYISAEEVEYGKPFPDIYIRTMEKLGYSPNETVIIEDSPSGIKAGKKANATVIGIHDPRFSHNQSEADYVVFDLFQSLTVIKDLNKKYSTC